MNRMLRHPDVVAGAVLAIVGALFTWLAAGIDPGPDMNTLRPNFFPLLCTAGITLAGLFILVTGLRSEPRPQPDLVDRRLVTVGALMAIYYLTFEHVDFRFGSWLFVLLTMVVLGCRKPLQLLLVPVLTAGGAYLSFRYIFEILLPTWI